jgi:arginyl-tRNA synthetase
MSTRNGTIVLLTEFMGESVEKARVEIMKRHPHLVGKELNELAKIIGYGALKYSILKISAEKNVTFSWDEALNFEGMSAPYIQYSFVRAKRILEKAGKYKVKKLKFTQQEEIDLIKEIARMPGILRECAKNYQVHSLAKYAYDLALRFNLFYEKCRVADEPDPDIRSSRLALSDAYKNVIKNVLFLLGIDAPTFM